MLLVITFLPLWSGKDDRLTIEGKAQIPPSERRRRPAEPWKRAHGLNRRTLSQS